MAQRPRKKGPEKATLLGGKPPSFFLYSEPAISRVVERQSDWASSQASHHGLRFTKFFGRWRSLEETPSDQPPKLMKETQQRVRRVQDFDSGPSETKEKWETIGADPVLDWLRPVEWPLSTARVGGRPKAEKVTCKAGHPDLLEESARRLEELSRGRGICFDIELTSRLLTGIGLPHPTENGFLFHPTLAVPYIRGTALKQVARNYAMENVVTAIDDEEKRVALRERVNGLFGAVDNRGSPKSTGTLAFLDALPMAPLTLVAEQVTSHYSAYYGRTYPADEAEDTAPADWYEPNPVTLLSVDAALDRPSSFRFAILKLRGATDSDLEAAVDWLKEGLKTFGVGAKTTLGYGRFREPQPP